MRRFRLPVAGVAAALLAAACHRDPPPRVRLKAIERCEDGVARAATLSTRERALSKYYAECAGLYVETPCHAAFSRAAKRPSSEAHRTVLEGCRAAYCPLLHAPKLEACAPGFVVTDANVETAWAGLHEAIFRYDLGAYRMRVETALVGFFMHLPPEAPKPPAPAP